MTELMRRDEVDRQFRAELSELLKRWGAVIEAVEMYDYQEFENPRMLVSIPPTTDERGNRTREMCEIDLSGEVQ